MVVMILVDLHHEGLSIGSLGNVHVPLMQFIHSRWVLLDIFWLDQRLAPDIFPFYFLLCKHRHVLDLEELSNSDLEFFSLRYMYRDLDQRCSSYLGRSCKMYYHLS